MKRLWLTALLAVSLTAIARSEDHTALTQKEIAEGWISLFDGKSTYGWTSPNDSKWTVFNGMLAPQNGKEGQFVTTTTFGDYELAVEFLTRSGSSLDIAVVADSMGDATGPNVRRMDSFFTDWSQYRLVVRDGLASQETFRSGRQGIAKKEEPKVKEDKQRPKKGHIALKGNNFVIRSIKVKPLSTKPIFNGKDLTGWKVYKGDPKREKSKWSVEDGILRLKNGPGDLQTKEQFADFVLQLECKTNGKHLNSGVFYRCLPDQYQQGYEAQIHNGFFEDGKKKTYTLDVFDPKTHKLKEKVKVESSAMDFGTGGIYRRSLATRQAAKDNEWFSMTVIANGRHVATWVNGVQVTDWTDNRPLNDNARQGCRLKKGAISIQGHDPTTDLSFRNIRIGDVPADKKGE